MMLLISYQFPFMFNLCHHIYFVMYVLTLFYFYAGFIIIFLQLYALVNMNDNVDFHMSSYSVIHTQIENCICSYINIYIYITLRPWNCNYPCYEIHRTLDLFTGNTQLVWQCLYKCLKFFFKRVSILQKTDT